jgi:4-carboxymuconolactone decarboxylase
MSPKPAKGSRYAKGLALRRRVLGDAHVDKALASVDAFTRDYDRLIHEYVWADTWARPGLPLKTRSLLNMALLTTLNRQEELRLHFLGALRNGCTLEEVREVLLHTAVYAGVPAIVAAFRTLREVLADLPPDSPAAIKKRRPKKRRLK